VKNIIIEANNKVTSMLQEHRASLDAIASALLEKETIMLDDMVDIIRDLEQAGEHPEAVPA
jgi:cell division protease FtsH